MWPRHSDETDYRFLAAPGARVQIALAADTDGQPQLQIFGDRAGLLSLANVLLWFVANAWRREFLSLAELPFVQCAGQFSLCIRLTAGESTGRAGSISRNDRGEQLEWGIAEDDLQRLALVIHRLVSQPGHEYDRLLLEEGSAIGVQVRMTDAADWGAREHSQFWIPAMGTSTGPNARIGRSYIPTTALAQSVTFADEMLQVALTDGRILSVPLAWFPALHKATPEQRARGEIGRGGTSLHWPDLDEDLSMAGLMAGVDQESA